MPDTRRRISRLRRKMNGAGIKAILISNSYDIEYLTGFSVPGLKLLILPGKKPVLFVDPMNETLIRDTLPEGAGVGISSGPVLRGVRSALSNAGTLTLGIQEKHLPAGELRAVTAGGSPDVVHAGHLIEALREIKEAREVRILRKNARATAALWREAASGLLPGMSEIDIAGIIDALIRSRGVYNSFPTIAACGRNTAYPHAVPTRKKWKEGEHVLVDLGIRSEGYCSDLTRVFYKGRINRQIRDIMTHVRHAHDIGISSVRPGMSVRELSRKVNSYLSDRGFGANILHGPGHGIGTQVHELPRVSVNSGAVLKPGMVITIEPGLYLRGIGGVRQEDMVLVTDKGCEVLTV